MADAAPVIIVTDLTKRFGVLTAVDRVTFRVAGGETVMLWGPNGAGKTTILRCLLGIVPFEGFVTVGGLAVPRHGKAARRQIGYMPQELGLPAEATVEEAITFYARLRQVPVAAARELLRVWQLDGARRQLVRQLSGGMKQRLALAIALLSDPPVLLLDEATSHLDVQARQEFSALLTRLKQDGKTLVICSHRVSDVWKLADRVVVLERGRLVIDGPPQQALEACAGEVTLTLTVPVGETGRAADCLAARGFAVSRNGTQVWVTLPAGRKAEALQDLAEARIRVLDFDVEANP